MADDAEEGEEEEEEFAAVGDFEPPDGWVVLPEPAEDEATWTKAKAKIQLGSSAPCPHLERPFGMADGDIFAGN